MTVDNMVRFLRGSLNIATMPTEEGGEKLDPEYLSLSDDDIKLILDVVMTRDYSSYGSVEFLPEKYIFPVVMLAKKELYFRLATSSAPLYDLGADNNNYLKKSQRFDHYLKCVETCDKELQDYLNDSEITVSDVYIVSRNGTRRNFYVSPAPVITLEIRSVYKDSVELCWSVDIQGGVSELYVTKEPVHDPYVSGCIIDGVVPTKTFDNSAQSSCRVKNLDEDCTYYVTLRYITRTGKYSVVSTSFSTHVEEPTEPEFEEVVLNE